jgi:hypothetical protein
MKIPEETKAQCLGVENIEKQAGSWNIPGRERCPTSAPLDCLQRRYAAALCKVLRYDVMMSLQNQGQVSFNVEWPECKRLTR